MLHPQGIIVVSCFLWHVHHVGYTHECLKLLVSLVCVVINVTLVMVFVSTLFCVYLCSTIVQIGLVWLVNCDIECVFVMSAAEGFMNVTIVLPLAEPHFYIILVNWFVQAVILY